MVVSAKIVNGFHSLTNLVKRCISLLVTSFFFLIFESFFLHIVLYLLYGFASGFSVTVTVDVKVLATLLEIPYQISQL